MSDSKHVQGPWGKQDCTGDFMIVGPNGEFIAGAVDAENADVIVAAPDLLAACRKAGELLEYGGFDLGFLDEAIAKAGG